MNDIILQCKTTENILRAAGSKDELLGLVAPDWQDICWSETDRTWLRLGSNGVCNDKMGMVQRDPRDNLVFRADGRGLFRVVGVQPSGGQ